MLCYLGIGTTAILIEATPDNAQRLLDAL